MVRVLRSGNLQQCQLAAYAKRKAVSAKRYAPRTPNRTLCAMRYAESAKRQAQSDQKNSGQQAARRVRGCARNCTSVREYGYTRVPLALSSLFERRAFRTLVPSYFRTLCGRVPRFAPCASYATWASDWFHQRAIDFDADASLQEMDGDDHQALLRSG